MPTISYCDRVVTLRNARELVTRARETLGNAMRVGISALVLAGIALVLSLVAIARARHA